MAKVDINVSDDDARSISDLAVRRYGDNSTASQQLVVEAALRWSLENCLPDKPRIVWYVEEGGDEVYKILIKGGQNES